MNIEVFTYRNIQVMKSILFEIYIKLEKYKAIKI